MPKINKNGPSYSDNDPRSRKDTHPLNPQAVPDQRDDEQVSDAELVEEQQAPDYGTWLKADLNAELDRREIEHDPKATNPELVKLLEEDDAKKASQQPPYGCE
jgi:hypothetical protein